MTLKSVRIIFGVISKTYNHIKFIVYSIDKPDKYRQYLIQYSVLISTIWNTMKRFTDHMFEILPSISNIVTQGFLREGDLGELLVGLLELRLAIPGVYTRLTPVCGLCALASICFVRRTLLAFSSFIRSDSCASTCCLRSGCSVAKN